MTTLALEPFKLGLADGEFEIRRPGKQELMEGIVFKNGHASAGTRHAFHLAQRREGLRKAEQALRAPNEIKASLLKGKPLDIRLGPFHTASSHPSPSEVKISF